MSSQSDGVNLQLTQLIKNRALCRQTWVHQKRLLMAEQRRTISEINLENDNGLQILFPEEIWLLIFNILDPNSQRNCSNACHLFRRYLKSVREVVLFREVLPILVHAKHLALPDLLKLRLVSKSWSFWVTHFFQSPQSWDSFPIFGCIDWTSPLITHRLPYSKKRSAVLNYSASGNPFLGRWLRPLFSSSYDLRYDSDLDECHITENRENKRVLMENLGGHVWYLAFAVVGSGEGVDEEDILLCLRTCKNLQRLEIGLVNNIWPSENENLVFTRELEQLSVPHLTRLIMSNKWYGNRNEYFLTIQHALVEKFSGQLEELQLKTWSVNYGQFNCPNLKCLRAEECQTPGILNSVANLKADNLQSLWLPVKEEGRNQLGALIKALNRFTMLEELRLEFNWQWIISEEEIKRGLEIKEELPTCGTVKKLFIKTGFSDGITYSLALCFPFLEHLQISYCCEGLDCEQVVEEVNLVPKIMLKSEMYRKTEDRRLGEVVGVREYLYENTDKMGNSPVWKMCPVLRNIQVVSKTGSKVVSRPRDNLKNIN